MLKHSNDMMAKQYGYTSMVSTDGHYDQQEEDKIITCIEDQAFYNGNSVPPEEQYEKNDQNNFYNWSN